MSWCEEFQLIPIREQLDRTVIQKVVKLIDDLPEIKKWRYPNIPGMPRKTQACLKSRALLHVHLEQLHSELPAPELEDLNYCLKRVPMLVDAILEVVVYRRTLRPAIAAMHMCQMLVQGTSKEKEDPFMQIPHMNQRIIKSLKSKKTKILTITDFYSLTEETRRGLLGKELDEPKLLDIEVFGKMFPFLKVSHEVKVADEDNVTAGSLVTVSVKLQRLKIADLASSENEERIAKKLASKDGTTAEEEEDEQAKILRLYAAKNAKAKKGGKKAPKKKPAKKSAAAPGADDDAGEGDADAEDAEDAGGDEEKKESGGDAADAAASATAAAAAVAVDAVVDTVDGEGGDDDDEEEEEEEESGDNVSDSEDDFDWGEDDVFQEQQEKQQKMKEKKRKGKESMPVHCPLFPEPKQEWWWVFIGQPGANALITEPQKVLALTDEDEIDVPFMAPPMAGQFQLTVYVISDSYYGIDHAETIKLDVKAGIKLPEVEEEIESEEDDPFLIEDSEDSDEDDFA